MVSKEFFSLLLWTISLSYGLSFDICAKGPDAWCKNLTTMNKCGVINFCLSMYKNQKSVDLPQDDKCQFCVYMVQDLVSQEDTSLDKIGQTLDESCAMLDEPYKSSCLQTETNKETIQLMIRNTISPFWICNAMSLCDIKREQLIPTLRDGIQHINLLENLQDPFQQTLNSMVNKFNHILIEAGMHDENGHTNPSENDLKGDPETIKPYIDENHNPWVKLIPAENINANVENKNNVNIDEDDILSDISPQFVYSIMKEPLKLMVAEFRTQALQANVKDENLCDMCVKGTTGLELLLEKKEFQEDLIAYLRNFCNIIESSVKKTMCKEALKEEVPEFLAFLSKELRAFNVCVDAKFCTPKMLQLVLTKPLNSSSLCEDCKKLVEQIRKFINKTQPNVMDGVRHVCQAMPKRLEEKCSSLTRNYIPAIYEYINLLIDPVQMCEAFGICMSNAAIHNSVNQMKMKDALEIISRNLLTFGVPHLGARQTAKKQISKEDDGKTSDMMPLPDLNSLSRYAVLSMRNDENNAEKDTNDVPNPEKCRICTTIVDKLIEGIGDDKTMDNIHQVMAKVCDGPLGPDVDKKICTNFITLYGDLISLLLQKNHTSGTLICKSFDFCQIPNPPTHKTLLFGAPSESRRFGLRSSPHSSLQNRNNIVALNALPGGSETNTVKCTLCLTIAEQMIKLLGNNRTRENIVHALDVVCDLVPGHYRKDCKRFIDDYGQTCMILFDNNVNATQVCQAFDFCQLIDDGTKNYAGNSLRNELASQRAKKIPNALDIDMPVILVNGDVNVNGDKYCSECRLLAAWLAKKIGENATEQQLLDMGHKFCHELPGHFKVECEKYLDDYGRQFLQLVSEYMDPDVVCQQVGLCKARRVDILTSARDIERKHQIV